MPSDCLTKSQVDFFNKQGYLLIENLLTNQEVEEYRKVYEDFLSNKIESARYRGDLAGQPDDPVKGQKVERITQIMIPSRLLPSLLDKTLHKQSQAYDRQLLGDDLGLDFDMLIDKAPFITNFRPESMIRFEREHGFDHTGDRKVNNEEAR